MADSRYVFRQVAYEAVTPIHVGAGQDLGIVDLPVVRERTTDHPYLPGSGIRGALRDHCEARDPDLVRRLFGPEGESEIGAGCVVVSDAHPVLFPVRTDPGVFRWITSPFVLERWHGLRSYFLDHAGPPEPASREPAAGTFAGGRGSEIFLEEYPYRRGDLDWTWPDELLGVSSESVLLLADADFLHFLRHATVVRQRNRLSTAKTVVDGQLFSIEAVPAETRFVGFLGATAERRAPEPGEEKAMGSAEADEALFRLLTRKEGTRDCHLSLGGQESVGWGLTRVSWTSGEAS